jgi:hypothetical protein
VGGLTLGGGMGWLTRKFGLSIDNLVSAEVVTADGQVRRACAGEHPDLFWAIRGGGGNFGVVTAFEFALHQVDPIVQFGLFFWPLDQGRQALRLAREITAAMPPEINAVAGAVNAPPAPFVPPEHHFAPGYVLLLTGFGSGPEHARLVTRIRESLPPLFDLVTPIPYVELQKLLDEANAWGIHGYEKGTYLQELSDPVIDVITEQIPRKNSPMSALLFYRLDGAYCQPGDDETAFSGGRSPRHGVFIVGLAPDAALLDADRGWVRRFWEALRPHAIDSGDGYINGITDFSDDRSAAATARPNTNGWPGSRPNTTRATYSTSTPTSAPPDTARRLGRGQRTDLPSAKARAVSGHSRTLRGANWCWRRYRTEHDGDGAR